MSSRGYRNQAYGNGNRSYGAGRRHGRRRGPDAQIGTPGYGGGGYGGGGYGGQGGAYSTPPAVIQEPWAVTQWQEYYIPTVRAARQRHPVIYVAAHLPGGGFGGGGFGGGGFGGGGFGGGLPMMI